MRPDEIAGGSGLLRRSDATLACGTWRQKASLQERRDGDEQQKSVTTWVERVFAEASTQAALHATALRFEFARESTSGSAVRVFLPRGVGVSPAGGGVRAVGGGVPFSKGMVNAPQQSGPDQFESKRRRPGGRRLSFTGLRAGSRRSARSQKRSMKRKRWLI